MKSETPNRVKVLLVEDNPGDQQLIKAMLLEKLSDKLDFQLCSRIEEANSLLRQNPVDAVLLDLHLPDADGVKGIRLLSSINSEMPIIILTGMQEDETALTLLQEGAQDYLNKDHLNSELLACSIRYAIERKRIEHDLRQSEARYELAASAAGVGIWDWDLLTDDMYIDPILKEILGYTDHEIPNQLSDWSALFHPGDQDAVMEAARLHLAGGCETYEIEHRMLCKDGNILWFLARGKGIRDAQGKFVRMLGTDTDITRRKELEHKLQHMATHDPLTELPNRYLLYEQSVQTLHRAERYSTRAAVLMVDLDYFKDVNDTFGHSEGDRVLKEVAARMKGCLRKSDTIARLGGDEFAVLLEDIQTDQDAECVVKKLFHKITKPIQFGENTCRLTASIGISFYPEDGSDFESLIKKADVAMYRAKKNRNAYQFYREL